jgi:hypothetical protein
VAWEQSARAARDAAAIMADLVAIQALRRATRHPDEVRRLVAGAVRDGEAPPRSRAPATVTDAGQTRRAG